jgi:hypothetical protein
MRTLLTASLLLSLVGCKASVSVGGSEQVDVNVHCLGAKEGERIVLNCDVAQKSGTAEVEACWDAVTECADGVVVTAPHTCGKVADGKTTRVQITDLPNVEKCTGTPVMKINNLTLNGKPSTSN